MRLKQMKEMELLRRAREPDREQEVPAQGLASRRTLTKEGTGCRGVPNLTWQVVLLARLKDCLALLSQRQDNESYLPSCSMEESFPRENVRGQHRMASYSRTFSFSRPPSPAG